MKRIELEGRHVRVVLGEDLSLAAYGSDGRLLWESSRSRLPTLRVRCGPQERELLLAAAGQVALEGFEEGQYRGHRLRLSGYEGMDLALELDAGLAPETGELLLQVAQVGGTDTLRAVQHLYCFEKPTEAGGYMVLPHGSGYLIPADCPDELPGEGEVGGFIGARWTLPLFGMVRGSDTLCAIVDTWWDCEVAADHVPGVHSALDFNWEASLGELAYARRLFIRFAEDMDYAGMAKLYRERARQQGFLRTLEEKAVDTPVIRKYVNNVLWRWPAWNPQDGPAVLQDLQRRRQEGFGINFFYPKWSPAGYTPEKGLATTASSGWQAFLHPTPVPGGWPTLVKLENQLHDMGCVVQGFVCPISQDPEGLQYDEGRWPIDEAGEPQKVRVSSHDALERMKQVFDYLEQVRLKLDVLYYDGFCAHLDMAQDYAPSHPVTRQQNFEAQNACFAETRRRGIMPGAELTRFWAMGECDYFFFTDWSTDRLVNTPIQGAPAPVGEPVPLFQLVFHDCFIAGFSGGGYTAYSPGYDWWDDRAPRLHELLHASAPAYNWLPRPEVPRRDGDSDLEERKQEWLKQWSAYYRAVALSAMEGHRFLAADHSAQQVEFAKGVVLEADLAGNRFRLEGVKELGEQWHMPPEL